MIFRLFYLFCLMLCGCSNLEHRSDALRKQPLPSTLAHPTKSWHLTATRGIQTLEAHLQLAADEQRLYMVDASGSVLAITPTGQVAWQHTVDTPITSGIVYADKTLLLGTQDARVLVLRAQDGTTVKEFRASSEVLAPPQVHDDLMVLHTLDGNVTGYSRTTGQQIWRYTTGDTNHLVMRVASRPLVTPEAVIVGLGSGKLIAIDPNSGEVLWDKMLGQRDSSLELHRLIDVSAPPVLDQKTVYAVSVRGKLMAIDTTSGALQWDKKLSSLNGLTVTAKHVVLADTEGTLWALDKTTGRSVWQQKALYGRRLTQPVVVNNQVIVGDEDGVLYWLDYATGALRAYDQVTDAELRTPPLIWQNQLFVLATNGVLSAYPLP